MTEKSTRLAELRAIALRTLSENAIIDEDGFTALSIDGDGKYVYLQFCKRCRRWLPVDSFSFMYKDSNKRQCYCKDCQKEYQRRRTEQKNLEIDEAAARKAAAMKVKRQKEDDLLGRVIASLQNVKQQQEQTEAAQETQQDTISKLKRDVAKKDSLIIALTKENDELRSHPSNLEKATNAEIKSLLFSRPVDVRTLLGAIGTHHPKVFVIGVDLSEGTVGISNTRECAEELAKSRR